MTIFGTRERCEQTRRKLDVPEDNAFKAEWMSSGDDPDFSPTIFMIEMPPHSVAPAHFHRNNQFQLFVEGTGKIGSHTIEPLTIHYAGAYTGYGPLVAGPDGLTYLTIRSVFEAGLIAVAGSAGQMRKGPRRGAEAGPVAVSTAEALGGLVELDEQAVLPMAADGLGATSVRLPRGTRYVVNVAPEAEGEFLIVVSGEVTIDTRRLSRLESAFVRADEPAVPIEAGSGGAQVIRLSMPRKNERYR
jgi:hypothetical protein